MCELIDERLGVLSAVQGWFHRDVYHYPLPGMPVVQGRLYRHLPLARGSAGGTSPLLIMTLTLGSADSIFLWRTSIKETIKRTNDLFIDW